MDRKRPATGAPKHVLAPKQQRRQLRSNDSNHQDEQPQEQQRQHFQEEDDKEEDDDNHHHQHVETTPSPATKQAQAPCPSRHIYSTALPIRLFKTQTSPGDKNNNAASSFVDTSGLCLTLRQILGLDGGYLHQNHEDDTTTTTTASTSATTSCSIQWLVIANYLIDPDFFLCEGPEVVHAVGGSTVVFYGHADAPFTTWENAVKKQQQQSSNNHSHKDATIDFQCLRPSDPSGGPTNPTGHTIPYGVHHTKFFLIGFAATVRVVIHTANLRYADIHRKAQGMYVQDFPLKTTNATTTSTQSQATSAFENTLLDYLDTYRYTKPRVWGPGEEPDFLRNVIRRYDYRSARAVLIPSTPGYHRLDAKELRGHLKVRQAIAQHTTSVRLDTRTKHDSSGPPQNTQQQQQPPIVCQFSSIGSLSEKYLREFQSSFDIRLARHQSSSIAGNDRSSKQLRLQLVYPTVQEIRHSLEGYAGGASVPGTLKNVTKPYLRPLFHRWTTKQQKPTTASATTVDGQKEDTVHNPIWKPHHVPHIKSYYQVSNDGESLEYFILGSQNLSMAAWGNIQNHSRSGGRRLFLRHWELGVLVSPSLMGCDRLVPWHPGWGHGNEASIPLPFCHLPQPYTASDQPWAVDVRYPEPDNFGRYSAYD